MKCVVLVYDYTLKLHETDGFGFNEILEKTFLWTLNSMVKFPEWNCRNILTPGIFLKIEVLLFFSLSVIGIEQSFYEVTY